MDQLEKSQEQISKEMDDLFNNFPAHIPASLHKASLDSFDYALGLRDGTIIRFREADIKGEWVQLSWDDDQVVKTFGVVSGPLSRSSYAFPRGIDVRISEILWCCDAPLGS